MRVLFTLLVFLASTDTAWGQWPPNGVLLSAPPAAGDEPRICPDGSGGAFVTWRDSRDYGATRSNVYIQRITPTGALPPGWPADGAPVCTALEYQAANLIAPDGFGGAFVTWLDFRTSSTTAQDLYIQRITPAGTPATGWQHDGVPIVSIPGYQSYPVPVADGAGGAFVVWEDERSSPSNRDIYAQHFGATGVITEGWPTNGLGLCTLTSTQAGHQAVSDGAGGLLAAWIDTRPNAGGTYGQRCLQSGEVLWQPDGKRILPLKNRKMLEDGEGGAFVVGFTSAPLPWVGGESSYIIQRITGSGDPAPGWPANGILVCEAPEVRETLAISSDGAGGLLMTWTDYRNYFDGYASDIYALRILPDGTRAPGWPANGLRVTNLPGFELAHSIVSDGDGGAYLSYANLTDTDDLVFIQHLGATGEVSPGWPPNGRSVMDQPRGFEDASGMVSDGAGGCIVAWESLGEIRARRFLADGPVATAISLASAVVEDGVVRLAWQGHDAAHLRATLERRTEPTEWRVLESLTGDASGRLTYEDRNIEPGTRYAYRLRWREAGSEHTTSEFWVAVPAALALALEGLRPNPAARELNVSFVLPSRAPARLELLDVTGRQRLARDVSELGTGRHVVRLGDATRYEPGVYWIRLSQDGEQRLARGVVIR